MTRKNKTTLGIESLESRQALAAYTLEILDTNNLVSPQVEGQMRSAADFTMRNLSNFVNWRGTLDLRIDVRPNWNIYDGITPAIMSVTPDRRNATVQEMLTGIDPYPTQPDVGMIVHLGYDGTVKLYGMPAYFDPNPATYVPADVPAGHFDFIGVLNHEVAHGIGFQFGTTDFSRHVTEAGGYKYFNGPQTVRVLGRPLPMSTFGGTHYGNGELADNPVRSGLMYQWGNYGGNRLDWGRLDLAVLRDLGLATKNESWLPLVDTMDSQAPRNTLSNLSVAENVPLGTSVGVVSTTVGSRGFSFSLPVGLRDNNAFRIVGNSLVTNAQIDYEAKASYTIQVRNTDAQGVWTDTVLTVGVRNMDDFPRIVAPASVVISNRTAGLGFLGVSGDYNALITVSVFARTGSFTSRITDPAVKVAHGLPSGGGRTIFLIGSPQSVSRNMRFVTYTGNDAGLDFTLNARLAGVWGAPEQRSVTLRPALPRVVVKPPILVAV